MFPEYVVLTWTHAAIPGLRREKPPRTAGAGAGESAPKFFQVFISLKNGWGEYGNKGQLVLGHLARIRICQLRLTLRALCDVIYVVYTRVCSTVLIDMPMLVGC